MLQVSLTVVMRSHFEAAEFQTAHQQEEISLAQLYQQSYVASSTALIKPQEAFAFEDDTLPFTVQFTIQLDPISNPNELSNVEIEVHPEWAPLATSRFKKLCTSGFYNNCPFFRVLPGFIAQFGISTNTELNKQWLYCEEGSTNCKQPLLDEKRMVPNKKGTLSFASSGKNTRRTQVFINTVDNSGIPNFLDQQGFVPFARVTSNWPQEGST